MKITVDKSRHMTQTDRKYARLAYDYCTQHNLTACTVNKLEVEFDLENKTGKIIKGKPYRCIDGQFRRESIPFSFVS